MTELATTDVDLLISGLTRLPPRPAGVARPVLVVVSGLPGTGKSYFSRRLAERVELAVLETDALRRTLAPKPTYEAAESARLFKATHQLIERLLKEGIPVLLDATNLVEAHRERLYNIADRLAAKLVLIRVYAPEEVVWERLAGREQGEKASEDHSHAGWQVYQRMRPSAEPIRRNHFAVDTSREITPVLEKVVREIKGWMRRKG